MLWGPPNFPLATSCVAVLIDHNLCCWKTDTILHSFLPIEATQILRIPIPATTQEDKFCWGEVSNGIYTVKSGYYLALKQIRAEECGLNDHPSLPNFHWKKLWSLPCQPKQIHFMWRLLHSTLPLRSNLIKRGVQCDPRCVWCEENAETEDHLFRDCAWTAVAWAQSPLKLQVQTLPLGSFRDWIDAMISSGPVETVCLFIALCHGFWPESLMPNQQEIKWHAPPLGWYKLNCDAAKSTNGHWGIGIVARDSDGVVIAAATRSLDTFDDPTLAEAMGLRLAMQFAVDLCLEDVIFESDNKIVMDQLERSNFQNYYHGLISQDCFHLRSRFRNCYFYHTRRSGNFVAHNLALFACSHLDYNWIEETPECIFSTVAVDICPGPL
ncbi:Ribonuclease H-like superfamily [Sesbania bispinosa]|nr:Ribonuclease H-like superfamily [Sesbania bispinosa]